MKIIIANWVYNWGSTGYIVRDLFDELTRMGHQVIVAVAINNDRDNPNVHVITKPAEWVLFWRLHRLGLSPFRGSTAASKRLIQLIEKEAPDVVNLHLLHGNRLNLYYLLKYLGEHRIKTVVTNHAELYYTGNCGHAYDCNHWIDSQCNNCPDKKEATGAFVFGNTHRNWLQMKKAFIYFKPENLLFTAVSPWVRMRFLQSPITKGFDCEVVLNGLDTSNFYPRNGSEMIAKRIGVEDYLLHVTANFDPLTKEDVKGGCYLVQLAEMMPGQKIVVVATSFSNADNLPNNIFVWGKAKDQNELAELYTSAKLTVIVSRRETFSMVTAESLCCGTPVVGFKAGGPESIAIPEFSAFVEQGDVKGLMAIITDLKNNDLNRKAISEEARQKYSPTTMAKGYLSAYETVLRQ